MKLERVWIGCSGWYYRHWAGIFYPANEPSYRWFKHYQKTFETVELNAPFYRWPKLETVKGWVRQATPGLRYSVKVNREITHDKRFQGTRRRIKEFYGFADILGPLFGCFLFQLPPSFHYSARNLAAVLVQVQSHPKSVVEFRHRTWWQDRVFKAFRKAGVAFCATSAPRFEEKLICTADFAYLRMHGVSKWYRYDYSEEELAAWVERIRTCDARELWIYFNNDREGHALRNAVRLRRMLLDIGIDAGPETRDVPGQKTLL